MKANLKPRRGGIKHAAGCLNRDCSGLKDSLETGINIHPNAPPVNPLIL
jgi:hypothetical protein